MISYLRISFLSFLIFFGYRTTFRFPMTLVNGIIEDLICGMMILFMTYRLIEFLRGYDRITPFEGLMFALAIFPVWSAIAALLHFDQPLFYGIATRRNFYLYLLGPFVFYLLKKKITSTVELRKSFLLAGVIATIVFYATWLRVSPEQYSDTMFVGYNSLKGGYIFKFIVTITIFPLIYFFISYFTSKKFYYLLFTLPFIHLLIFIRQDRSTILVTLFVLLFYFVKEIFTHSKARYLFNFFLGLIAILFLIEITDYAPSEQTIDKYRNLWLTVIGAETSESSTNVRRIEVIKVWPDIQQHFFFGNGDLSTRWQDGFTRIYGYFFPSDIGLIGILYVYGLIGTLLLMYQYVFAYKLSRKLKPLRQDIFLKSCIYFLLISFFDSLTAGQTVFFPANSTILIGIMYFYYFRQQSAHIRILKI